LGKVLVDWPVKRTKQEQRSIKTIVLIEAIAVGSKIMEDQHIAIAACSLARYVGFVGAGAVESSSVLFGQAFEQTHLSFFMRGFGIEQIREALRFLSEDGTVFRSNLRDSSLMRLFLMRPEELPDLAKQIGRECLTQSLDSLLSMGLMLEHEIQNDFKERYPNLSELIDILNRPRLMCLKLTTA
jgi:hypothetical protein